MAVEPDGLMGGSAWPPDWQTGWVTGRWSDITGASPVGGVRLTNSAQRAVARTSKTTVSGGFVEFPITGGIPGGAMAQENSDGVFCIEFPIGTDPDVTPAEMQINAKETFTGGVLIRKVLTAEHTLDNPLWLTDDLESVKSQTGIVQVPLWEVANESMGIPTEAAVGDYIFYVIPGKFTRKTGA